LFAVVTGPLPEMPMQYDVSFGTAPARACTAPGQTFRLAVLGDFSGRANAGLLQTGGALATRKPVRVDADNIDSVVERMKLSLQLTLDAAMGAVAVPIASMDDFHPDQLVDNVDLFQGLLALRKSLASRAGFDRASREVFSWGGLRPCRRRRVRPAARPSPPIAGCRISPA
jgi:type VI secretion system protein ImpC